MTDLRSPETRLAESGIRLPAPPNPSGNYVPAVLGAGLLEISGQVAFVDGSLRRGRVGEDITTDEAVELAETCTRNAVSIAREAAGSLDTLEVHRVRVFVACTGDYGEQHIVANGASSFLRWLFGPGGEHTRTAIGVYALPLGAPVEVELTFRTKNTLPVDHPIPTATV